MKYVTKLFIACICVLFSLTTNAQSFLNGDFENTTAIGDQINLVNSVFDSKMAFDTGFGTNGNLDIITSATYGGGGPEHGNWYCAITGAGTDKLSMKLSAPLVAGNTYSISFYDRADGSYIPEPIQIGLSTSATSLGTAVYITPAPATVGVWTQRTFSFVAPNNGQYITAYMPCCALSNWVNVDNFTMGCSLYLGPDTSLCTGNSYLLNATTANATAYLWQDGSSDSTYNVTAPGLYWARVSSPGCTASDTVRVNSISNLVVFLGNDTAICSPATLVLNANNTGATYRWQDSSALSQYSVSQTGTYSVTVTNGGCIAADTIHVAVNNTPVFNLGSDTAVCTGDSVILVIAQTGATYFWQDSTTASTYIVKRSGLYRATVSDSGCTAKDSIQVTVRPVPLVRISASRDTICSSDSAQICANTGFASYLWNVGGHAPCISAKQAGNYYVTVTDNNGCTAESNHVALHVNPQPQVSLSINGDTIRVYGAFRLQWFANQQPIPGDTGSMLMGTKGVEYQVQLTDSSGCTTLSSPVRVLTGIADLIAEAIYIYPNPFSRLLQLTVSDEYMGTQLEIFDDNGKIIFSSKLENTNTQLELNIAPGIYLLRIASPAGIVVKKLVKL